MKKTVNSVSKLRLNRETLRGLGEIDLVAIDGAGSTPSLPQFCRSGVQGTVCTNPLYCTV